MRIAVLLLTVMVWWGTIQWAYESGRRRGCLDTQSQIEDASAGEKADRDFARMKRESEFHGAIQRILKTN